MPFKLESVTDLGRTVKLRIDVKKKLLLYTATLQRQNRHTIKAQLGVNKVTISKSSPIGLFHNVEV